MCHFFYRLPPLLRSAPSYQSPQLPWWTRRKRTVICSPKTHNEYNVRCPESNNGLELAHVTHMKSKKVQSEVKVIIFKVWSCKYDNRSTIITPWQWALAAACNYWSNLGSVHQVLITVNWVARGSMKLSAFEYCYRYQRFINKMLLLLLLLLLSLPDTSTHDQQWEFNSRPFDLDSNAQVLWSCPIHSATWSHTYMYISGRCKFIITMGYCWGEIEKANFSNERRDTLIYDDTSFGHGYSKHNFDHLTLKVLVTTIDALRHF